MSWPYNQCCLSGYCTQCRTRRFKERRKEPLSTLWKATQAFTAKNKACADPSCGHSACTLVRAFKKVEDIKREPAGYYRPESSKES